MGTFDYENNGVSRVLLVLLLLFVFGGISYWIVSDIRTMQHATTSYAYCRALCSLCQAVTRMLFVAIIAIEAWLVYVNKQYSRWTIWLFYFLGIYYTVYYFVASEVFEYMYDHIDDADSYYLPTLARKLYIGPVSDISFFFFLVPKFIKDAMKLKEEQDLTI